MFCQNLTVLGTVTGPFILTHPLADQTIDAFNLLPAAGGTQSLGAPGTPWDAALNGVTIDGSLALATTGTYTSGAQNEYCTSLLDGLSPATEYSLQQGGLNATEALVGGATIPLGTTQHQVNAVSGYIVNNANSASRTVANGGAGYFQARAAGNGTAVWGINPLVADDAGVSSHDLTGCEIDVNVSGTPSHVWGQLITGILNGTMPVDSWAINIAPPFGTQRWWTGIEISDGTVNSGGQGAVVIGALDTSGTSVRSNFIAWNYFDSGGVPHQVQSYVDGTGNLIFLGNGMRIGASGDQVVTRVTSIDLTTQSAAIGSTQLNSGTLAAGQYRVTWNAKITTAATTGAATSTLGPLTIAYTDPDSTAPSITAAAQIAAGTIATSSAANTTTTVLLGMPMLLNVKAGTNILYTFGYASNTAAQMVYNLHIRLEAL